MPSTTLTSSLYPAGSVFTVDLHEGVQTGWVDRPANDQLFDIAVIEFNDDGSYVDRSQLSAAAERIQQIRHADNNKNGAIVVVFIHGWHHDARWDVGTNDGDSHFKAFREVLRSLSLREAERYLPEPGGRRVIGVYFGWNGDPAGSRLRSTRWLTHSSFWNRYRTAKRIADSEDIRNGLQAIVAATKDPIEARPESPLIMIGHSMGALMLESAFLSLLTAEEKPLVRPRASTTGSCVDIQRRGSLISFPDVLLAVNSAAHSSIFKNIKSALENQELKKTLIADDIHYSPPLLISLTSSSDSVTKIIWRIAHFPRLWRRTDGHDSSLFTHTFEVAETKVSCEPKNFLDFGQNWHCLRAPIPAHKPTPIISIDLPTRERNGVADRPDHTRYQLTPLVDIEQAHLAWIFQVPPEIVSNHNDIFNSRSSTLMMALIQISGAVMSLAEDLRQNFETEAL